MPLFELTQKHATFHYSSLFLFLFFSTLDEILKFFSGSGVVQPSSFLPLWYLVNFSWGRAFLKAASFPQRERWTTPGDRALPWNGCISVFPRFVGGGETLLEKALDGFPQLQKQGSASNAYKIASMFCAYA